MTRRIDLLRYVKNTAGNATLQDFIIDWEPIGGLAWDDLSKKGYVTLNEEGKIALTEEGQKYHDGN